MVNRWKIVVGLITLILLGVGVYFVSDIYATSCHKEGGGGCKHGEGGHGEQPSDKVKEDANTPEALLKKADKLLKEAAKTKNVASLMKHCEQMLNKAGEIMADCNKVTEGPGWFDSQSVDTATNLMMKCVEITAKSQSLIPKDQKKTIQENAVYTCSMHPEIMMDKPGRCPKCGMNLEKRK